MSFDLRRAEPTRRDRYYWAIALPAIVWAFLAILVGFKGAALQDVDDRVADWGFDMGHGNAVHTFSLWFGPASSNWTVAVILLAVAGYAAWRGERRVAGWIVLSGVLVIAGNALVKLVFRAPAAAVGRAPVRHHRVLVPERPRRRRRPALDGRDPAHHRPDRSRPAAPPPHPRLGAARTGDRRRPHPPGRPLPLRRDRRPVLRHGRHRGGVGAPRPRLGADPARARGAHRHRTQAGRGHPQPGQGRRRRRLQGSRARGRRPRWMAAADLVRDDPRGPGPRSGPGSTGGGRRPHRRGRRRRHGARRLRGGRPHGRGRRHPAARHGQPARTQPRASAQHP